MDGPAAAAPVRLRLRPLCGLGYAGALLQTTKWWSILREMQAPSLLQAVLDRYFEPYVIGYNMLCVEYITKKRV